MKERPILFSGQMVRAILEGRKTQTRRIVKGKYLSIVEECMRVNGKWCWHTTDYDLTTPYGEIGDRLWVKETWAPGNYFGREGIENGVIAQPIFRATFPPSMDERHDAGMIQQPKRWKPSIFMPRWASRITLDIAAVRTERVQSITEADAIAEGIWPVNPSHELWKYRASDDIADKTAVGCYRKLWESINGSDSWNENPFVWVITFPLLNP